MCKPQCDDCENCEHRDGCLVAANLNVVSSTTEASNNIDETKVKPFGASESAPLKDVHRVNRIRSQMARLQTNVRMLTLELIRGGYNKQRILSHLNIGLNPLPSDSKRRGLFLTFDLIKGKESLHKSHILRAMMTDGAISLREANREIAALSVVLEYLDVADAHYDLVTLNNFSEEDDE